MVERKESEASDLCPVTLETRLLSFASEDGVAGGILSLMVLCDPRS